MYNYDVYIQPFDERLNKIMLPIKRIISENIKLSSIRTDKFKTGTLTFSLYMPLTERDYLLGLVLAGVMRRGTKDYPSMTSINRRLDELYATTVDVQCVIHGNVMSFIISAELLENRFVPDGTDILYETSKLMSQILLSPLIQNGVLPEATVESEKVFVKDSLSSEINNTRFYAATRLKELMSRDGSVRFPKLEYLLKSIGNVTAKELTDFHARLVSCSQLNIFYVGSENIDSVCDRLSHAFVGYIGATRHALSPINAQMPREYISVTEDMPVNQGKLALGMRTGAVLGTKDCAAAVVLNEIFGASPASKLFLNVRERLGLCYYCGSSFGLLSGDLTVSSGIDVRNREAATEEILAQFEEIKKGNVSDAELFAARKSLEYTYAQIYDSPFSLQSFYSVRELAGIYETVEEYKQKILSVSKDEICELARQTVLDTCFFINGTLSCGEEEEYE